MTRAAALSAISLLLGVAACSDVTQPAPLTQTPLQAPGSTADQPGVWEGSGAPAGYRRVDLGGLHGVAMNNGGEVVGSLDGEPVIWRRGKIVPMAGLPGDFRTEVHDINARGQVVGSFVDDGGLRRAFLWQNGEVLDLGTLEGDAEAVAYGINDGGEVAGVSMGTGHNGFVWRRGEIRPLPDTEVGNSYLVRAINNRGDVVGASGDVPGFWGSAFRDPQPRALFTGGESSKAVDVNDARHVVGLSYFDGPSRNLMAWVWEDGTTTVLEILGAEPQPNQDIPLSDVAALNQSGTVVGLAADPDFRLLPVMWSPPDFEVTVLGEGGRPWDINDRGVIGIDGPDGSYLLMRGGGRR